MIGGELEFRFTLTAPDGTEYDVTDRAAAESLGSVQEETEEDLLILTHSDLDVVLDDADGAMSRLFAGARRGDLWTLVVERETGRRRPLWERIFAGVLDVPMSIRLDRTNAEVNLQVFAWSKSLELYSPTALMRDLSGRTGTVTAGGTTVTLAPDVGVLLPGDRILLVSATGVDEERVVKTVASATTVTTTEPWDNAFSGAACSLLTPYPRGQSVDTLARRLFAVAGIPDATVDISQQLAALPFPGSLNTGGLPATSLPVALLEWQSALKVYTGGRIYSAPSISAGFTDGGAASPQQDWRPYLAAPPAALLAQTAGTVRDYVDAAHPAWSTSIVDIGTGAELWLARNGTRVTKLATQLYGNDGGGFSGVSIEVAGVWGEVWVSYQSWSASTTPSMDPDRFDERTRSRWTGKTVRCKTADASVLGELSGYCHLRFAVDRMAAFEIGSSGRGEGDDPSLQNPTVRIYDRGALVLRCETAPGVKMATFRRFGGTYAAVRDGGAVVLWSAATGKKLADYAVGSGQVAYVATVFDGGGQLTPAYVAYAGDQYVVVSTAFSGVVPYADFADMSCAAALRELAVVSGAHAWVDEYGSGNLVARKSARIMGRDPIEIGPALESTEMPAWEWLRRSVQVDAKDEDGNDISVVAGDPADSAYRLAVDVRMPITPGLAGALAQSYLDYLGADPPPRQLDEVIEMPADRPVRLFDVVSREGAAFVVLRVETNYQDREQAVQLVERVF